MAKDRRKYDIRPDDMQRINTPALADKFIDEQVEAIREQVGSDRVLLALSGGVDSSVACFTYQSHWQTTRFCSCK